MHTTTRERLYALLGWLLLLTLPFACAAHYPPPRTDPALPALMPPPSPRPPADPPTTDKPY